MRKKQTNLMANVLYYYILTKQLLFDNLNRLNLQKR